MYLSKLHNIINLSIIAGKFGVVLDLSQRVDIAIDVAHALTYLHLYAGNMFSFFSCHLSGLNLCSLEYLNTSLCNVDVASSSGWHNPELLFYIFYA